MRSPRSIRTRGAAALAVAVAAPVAAIATTAAVGSATAGATSARRAPFTGTITYATQDTWHHKLSIQGLAWDPNNEAKSLPLTVLVNGRYVGHATADIASNAWAREHHVRGKHAFRTILNVSPVARTVVVQLAGRSTDGIKRNARHVSPPASTRIVEVASRYVGKARYVYGGDSPRGFDCSGLVKYTYKQAGVKKNLPHNSESQRHVRGIREIQRKNAKPGDLVFYFGGGSAYHVAIYTGRGWQVSAADPQEGIKRQKVWSHNVEFMTMTH